MADKNFGFQGNIPPNVSIDDNIKKALEYKDTHSALETLNWFRKMVGPQSQNSDGTLNWDFKMYDKNTRVEGQSSAYEDFGNFHYGVILKSLGFSNDVIKSAAGGAQSVSDSNGKLDLLTEIKKDYVEASNPFKDKQHGWKDNPEDQIQIDKGIQAAENAGYKATGYDALALTELAISKGADYFHRNFDKILDYVTDSTNLSQSQRQELAQIISAGGNPNDFLRAVYDKITITANKADGYLSEAQADTTQNYYKSLNVNDYVENSDGSITLKSNGKAVAVEMKDEKGNIILIDTDGNKVVIDDKGISTVHNEQTITFRDEHGNLTQVTYDKNSDLLIYGDPANPNKIAFTDDKGDYQVWEKDKDGNFVQTNKIDYSQISNTAINQIGSLIIANNQNFSNIEKIAVSTSVATIADFATYKGSSSEFELQKDAAANLQGAVVGFAVSAYFAKNDNISDILNFSTLATKKKHKIIYYIINKINPVNNPNYFNIKSLLVG